MFDIYFLHPLPKKIKRENEMAQNKESAVLHDLESISCLLRKIGISDIHFIFAVLLLFQPF